MTTPKARSRRALTRRGLLAVLALLAAAWAGHSAVAQSLPPAPEPPVAPVERRILLRFLTEGEFPPFNYYDDEGILTGFNVDLARALCLEMNVACDIQVKAWEELLPAAAKGEVDAVIAGHVVTAKALRQVDFTDRYFHTAARFAGRRDGTKLDITPDGLEGRRIGVTRGTAHEAFLAEFFRFGQIQPFDSAERAREALVQGKIGRAHV